ncbi:hypothetical protein F2P79_010677 [Pimephales promelas]|nr:hypothetical protein F2P79_010677 [Pimephales promelas]
MESFPSEFAEMRLVFSKGGREIEGRARVRLLKSAHARSRVTFCANSVRCKDFLVGRCLQALNTWFSWRPSLRRSVLGELLTALQPDPASSL